MVEPHSSNLRVITTNFLGVRIFRKFTVLQTGTTPQQKNIRDTFLHGVLGLPEAKAFIQNFSYIKTMKTENIRHVHDFFFLI